MGSGALQSWCTIAQVHTVVPVACGLFRLPPTLSSSSSAELGDSFLATIGLDVTGFLIDWDLCAISTTSSSEASLLPLVSHCSEGLIQILAEQDTAEPERADADDDDMERVRREKRSRDACCAVFLAEPTTPASFIQHRKILQPQVQLMHWALHVSTVDWQLEQMESFVEEGAREYRVLLELHGEKRQQFLSKGHGAHVGGLAACCVGQAASASLHGPCSFWSRGV